MTEIFEPTSPHDPRLARRVDGLLGTFNAGGVVDAADVRVAERVAALAGEDDERVLLATALAVRSVRGGSVGLDLDALPDLDGTELAWPDRGAWVAAIEESALVAAEVLHVEHDLVYLDRYHRLERQVAVDLVARIELGPPAVDEAVLAATLQRVSGEHPDLDPPDSACCAPPEGRAGGVADARQATSLPPHRAPCHHPPPTTLATAESGGSRFSAEQAAAVDHAARHRTTVLTGGPGTGKTTTVARVVLALADQFAVAHDRRMSIALAAPTGKAATRLQEAVAAELGALGALGDADHQVAPPEAMTLHRLLGWRPDNATRFRHDRGNRLKYDLVVVDEASMVDLTMMARLLEAVRPDSRLVLVGDPRQLTSVGAGAVLSDLVSGFAAHPDSPVVALTENHRSTEEIKGLAAALRDDSPDAADRVLDVLRAGTGEVTWVETDDPVVALQAECTAAALRVRNAAVDDGPGAALAAIEAFRLLCAHRDGPYGVRVWNRHVEQWLAAELGAPLGSAWYAGRPLLVTSNDYALDVYNGETGVVVTDPAGRPRAWIAGAGAPRPFAPARLDAIETMHAMTIHKSQGSQATRIAVLLPEEGSRLLSRELFYTAVTRARESLLVVGSEAAVRAAVTTTAQRATGLRHRLTP